MKRAWMRTALAAGVVGLGLYAIALATRGSVSTSLAAPPGADDRPRYVRPTDDPTLVENPRSVREPFRKSSLALRQPAPAASASRYVTQADVIEPRPASPYEAPNRYNNPPVNPANVQQMGYDGTPTPAKGLTAASEVPLATDAGPHLVSPAPPRPFPGASHAPMVTPQIVAPPLSAAQQVAPLTVTSHEGSLPPAAIHTSEPLSTSSQPASPSTGTGKPGQKHLEGPQAPTLVIEKSTPDELQVGRPAKFTVTVRNVGQVVAHDVEIRDDVPAGTQLLGTTPRANRGSRGELIWPVGTIKPNDEISVQVELMPMTEGELGSVATVQFATSASGRVLCTRPELLVEVVAPREVLSGDEWPVTIKVSNTGTGVAAGVTLSEAVPAGFEHPAGAELEYDIGDLKPDEMREVRLSLRAVKAGPLVNRLKVRGDGPLLVMKETSVTIVAPALDVTLEGAKRRYLDRQAIYTLTLSNPGTAPAREVMLAAQLPPGLEFVEANNAGQFDARTRTVHWQLEELPAQEQGKVTITTMPTEPGELPLRITGTAIGGLAVEKQEMIRVEGIAALVFQVLDQADPIDVKGETNYEIRVTNQGSKAAENVQILAQLPPELKALSAEGPARYEIVGQQVIFQPLARLAAKSETVYLIRVQAQRAGDVKIAVQLKSADLSTPVMKEEATRILSDQ